MSNRVFIDIHLRQWPEGHKGVKLEDSAGNVVTLDGLVHMQPHQFILLDLGEHDTDEPIKLPGHFTDYHPSNAQPVSEANPRVPHPQPVVKRDGDRIVHAKTGEEVQLTNQGHLAGKPLGVQPE